MHRLTSATRISPTPDLLGESPVWDAEHNRLYWVDGVSRRIRWYDWASGAIDAAAAKDVHIYPVAASGADARAEFTMRTAAQITGGRYVFLTNDSGVGNGHAEPHIPCYAVTRLDSAIIRSIETELTGKPAEANASEILRNVGQPDVAGKCKLASGALVASF